MLNLRAPFAALFLAAVAAMPHATTAQETTADTVVATVNGTEITMGHMAAAYAGLPQQYQNLPTEQLFRGILQQLVNQSVLAQTFADNPPRRVTLSLENERRSLLAGEVIERVMQQAADNDAVLEVYERDYENGVAGQEFNASHILVETEIDALAIIEELNAGADFAELAKRSSTGPSGPNGGALGWFGPGMMVPPFEAAVTKLSKGQISPPVQTQFGWHVVLLNDLRDTPPLADVRAQIEEQLRDEAVNQEVATLLSQAELNETDATTFDIELMRDLSILDN